MSEPSANTPYPTPAATPTDNSENTKIVEIPGPVISGRQRNAWIKIKSHEDTATVSWNIGKIRLNGIAANAIDQRSQKQKLHYIVEDWCEQNHRGFTKRTVFAGEWFTLISGRVSHLLPDAAADLAALLGDLYRQILEDLPTSLVRKKMLKSEIHVGKRYTNNAGGVREVIAIGPPRLPTGGDTADEVQFRVISKTPGSNSNVGAEYFLSLKAFSKWARCEVKAAEELSPAAGQ